jgi:DNA-binding transcriptional ArsR family regulator
MNKKQFQKYENQAKVLKALAHPTRLLIVDELSKKEHCVCDLTDLIGSDTSTVSKHLSVLKNAGIVGVEKRGLNVFYTLKIPCAVNFLECARDVMKAHIKEQMKMMNE